MAQEDSDDYDEDYEDLQCPTEPPERPLSAANLYAEHYKHQSNQTVEQLRQAFNQNLGKNEKQKWKTKHKKAKRRYHKLLDLYRDAHPDYNPNTQSTSNSNSNRNRNSGTKGNKRRRNSDPYGSRGGYIGINTYDNMGNSNASPATKRRKRNQKQSGGNSLDDFFREINSGSKRVIRDPEKFSATDENIQSTRNLVAAMREAAEQDWKCNKESKPTTNTFQLLDTVVSELSKKLFHRTYLDETSVLDALRDWIHPLPDGSLPAERIRTEIIRIIEKFALHEYDQQTLNGYLQASEDNSKDPSKQSEIHPNLKSFSKSLMNLWANPKETNSNKQLLRKIMEKWIRTLTGADSSYAELREEMRESRQTVIQRNGVLKRQKRSYNFGEQKRAKIPEKPWHDFATAPADLVDATDGGHAGNRQSAHPMQERMRQTFKRSASSKQASKPSITGRKTRK